LIEVYFEQKEERKEYRNRLYFNNEIKNNTVYHPYTYICIYFCGLYTRIERNKNQLDQNVLKF